MLRQASIWQVARATSAASSFFDPIEFGDEEFVDGATPANNPIYELWTEASDAFHDPDDPEWDLGDSIHCLVSVGTGIPTLKSFGKDPIHIASSMVAIATDTEKRAQDFHKHHARLYEERRCFRFNVLRGLEKVGLEDAEKRKEIVSATRLYIQGEDTLAQMRACAGKLKNRGCAS
jgi:predicted acylesterase/phospholipase RssA